MTKNIAAWISGANIYSTKFLIDVEQLFSNLLDSRSLCIPTAQCYPLPPPHCGTPSVYHTHTGTATPKKAFTLSGRGRRTEQQALEGKDFPSESLQSCSWSTHTSAGASLRRERGREAATGFPQPPLPPPCLTCHLHCLGRSDWILDASWKAVA